MEEEDDDEDEDDDDECDVPDIIQGEIARLQRHFKVTLDPSAASRGATVSLVCHMEDANLPSGTVISFFDFFLYCGDKYFEEEFRKLFPYLSTLSCP